MGQTLCILQVARISISVIFYLIKNSNAASKSQHKVDRGLFLDIVVTEGPIVFQLLARKDEALLIRRNALLVSDLLLDHVHGIRGFAVHGNGFSSKSLDEDLHLYIGRVPWDAYEPHPRRLNCGPKEEV